MASTEWQLLFKLVFATEVNSMGQSHVGTEMATTSFPGLAAVG